MPRQESKSTICLSKLRSSYIKHSSRKLFTKLIAVKNKDEVITKKKRIRLQDLIKQILVWLILY